MKGQSQSRLKTRGSKLNMSKTFSLGTLVSIIYTHVYIEVFHKKQRSQIKNKFLTLELSKSHREMSNKNVCLIWWTIFYLCNTNHFLLSCLSFIFQALFCCNLWKLLLIMSNQTVIFIILPSNSWIPWPFKYFSGKTFTQYVIGFLVKSCKQ